MAKYHTLASLVLLTALNMPSARAEGPSVAPAPRRSIEEYITGEANLKDVKLVQIFDGKDFKSDWKRSQIGGTFSTRLASKDDANKPLEAKVLGPSGATLITSDGKESEDFILLTSGSGYCVHPSFYKSESPKYRCKEADKLGKINITIEPVPGHPEIVRATGLILLARTSDSALKSIDDSPVFWPGITWTVTSQMTISAIIEGKAQPITLKPGQYRLDENSLPRPIEGKADASH